MSFIGLSLSVTWYKKFSKLLVLMKNPFGFFLSLIPGEVSENLG